MLSAISTGAVAGDRRRLTGSFIDHPLRLRVHAPALRDPGLDRVDWQETVQSAVTASCGVDWNEEMVGRDLMRNFRDANRNDLGVISAWTDQGTTLNRSA